MSALINPRYYPMIPNLVSECFVLYSTNFHILSFFVDWATSYMEIVIVRFKKSLVSPTVSRNLYLKSQAITNIKFDIPFFFLCQRSQKAKKQKSQFLFDQLSTQCNSTQLNWVKSDNNYWLYTQPPQLLRHFQMAQGSEIRGVTLFDPN